MKYFKNEMQFILSGIAKMLCCLLVLSVAIAPVNGQILTDFPCYAVSNANGASNLLFTYNPASHTWSPAPNRTGTTTIAAIAIDPVEDIIYATDGGTFGTIDAITGVFSAIGSIGAASGNFETILLDDVKGMTYDPINKIMFGVHRILGEGPGTEDILFQIDITTGAFIPFAMADSYTGIPVDYAIIPAMFDGTVGNEVYNVNDIAYNPFTGQLFAVHSQNGPSAISELDPISGDIYAIVLDISDDIVEGLGFTYLGELYATTGENGFCDPYDPTDNSCKNTFIYIDLLFQDTSVLSDIDPTGANRNFESFDCSTAYNDLALEMILDPSTPSTVNPGDEVTFLITVYNQGSIENSEIYLTDYIPAGLTLSDSNWTAVGEMAFSVIPEALASGASAIITITFVVNTDFTGTLTNTAEISASFNNNITDNLGNILPLPDIDSQPDDINDEDPAYVINNEINQGGPNALADEDDHDIELLTVGTETVPCPPNLVITSTSSFKNMYQSSGHLNTNGLVLIAANQQVEFKANIVTLNSGFEVKTGADFYANSGSCN